MSKLQIGINHVSNKDYHADNEFLSSSNLKLLLKDREQFYKEKILGIKERKESSAFDEGSLVHSMILEPERLNEDYAFFNGLRKVGPEFESYKRSAGSKTVISKPQKIRCEQYVKAYQNHPVAPKILSNGAPEYTICAMLSDVPVKIRADYINVDEGYIVDIKTTSYPADVDTFRITTTQWGYDLSAALYSTVASQHYGKPFAFYFVVIDKKNLLCEVYKASESTLTKGSIQVSEALKVYKQCKQSGNWTNAESVLKFESKEYEILEV